MAAYQTHACGGYFPNRLLDNDGMILAAPHAIFQKELERMNLVRSSWRALPATNGSARQTFEIELTDLRTALDAAHAADAKALLETHRREREKIGAFDDKDKVLRPTNAWRIKATDLPRITPGLPREFSDYFRGSIAWHQNKIEDARAAWTGLLNLPASQRHFKSPWAAFLLGKRWEEDHHKRASSWFQNVRALAAPGFVDILGLASSSLGWEARLQLGEERYAPAIDLYLEQAASGDPSAVNSLRFAASAAMQRGARALRPLAAHPRAQRVITAYVISGCREPVIDVDGPLKEPILELAAKSSYLAPRITGWHTFKAPVQIWLESVEAAKIRDVDSAEQLALAAYQAR